MENLYFYIEDCDGGFIADTLYMNTKFNNVEQKLMCVGTKEDIENYISWLCNEE